MKKLIITATLTSLLLILSYPSQAGGLSESNRSNQHAAKQKRDQGHNVSRSNKKYKARKQHKKRAKVQQRGHGKKVSVSHAPKRNTHRQLRQHPRVVATHANPNYGYEPRYARSHDDYYGRYYGYYDQYGNYRDYDYGYYDDHGRYQAHRHNSTCGHLATPILGAVVAGIVIASIVE